MSYEFTNFRELFDELKLDPEKHNLWIVHHDIDVPLDYFEEKIQSSPNIKHFLLYQEFGLKYLLKKYHNAYLWESTVYPEVNRHFTYLWWFDQTVRVSNALELHRQLQDNRAKKPEFTFDALIGSIRHNNNRKFLLDRLKETGILKDSIWNVFHNSVTAEWIQGSKFEIIDNSCEYPQSIYEDKSLSNTSTFLPIDIFNDSWYSIVSETDPSVPFFTEKTAKPLLSKRLFVMFGAFHHLKKLQSLGFKTFDNIIDESYDNEKDINKRWEMAFEQVVKLSKMNPVKVYEIIQETVEHNQERMLHFSWDERMRTEIKAILNLEK